MTAPLYLTICGTRIEPWVSNDKVHDMTWDRTVDDIATLQHEDVFKVIEIGTGRDVTQDMLKQVADLWAVQGDALTRLQFEMLELHLGTQFAKTFHMEDA